MGSSDESSDTQKVEGPEQGRGRTRQSLQISVQRKLGQMLLSPLFAWLVFALFTCVGVSLQSWLMWSSGTKGYTRLLQEFRVESKGIVSRTYSDEVWFIFRTQLHATFANLKPDVCRGQIIFVCALAEAFDLKGSNESRAGDVRASVRIETLRDGNRDSLLLNWSSPEIHTVFIHGPQGGNVTHSSVSLGLNFLNEVLDTGARELSRELQNGQAQAADVSAFFLMRSGDSNVLAASSNADLNTHIKSSRTYPSLEELHAFGAGHLRVETWST